MGKIEMLAKFTPPKKLREFANSLPGLVMQLREDGWKNKKLYAAALQKVLVDQNETFSKCLFIAESDCKALGIESDEKIIDAAEKMMICAGKIPPTLLTFDSCSECDFITPHKGKCCSACRTDLGNALSAFMNGEDADLSILEEYTRWLQVVTNIGVLKNELNL